MDYSIDHRILTSLKEYAEFRLIRDANAYTNFTDETLYAYSEEDSRIDSKVIHGSRFGQIVHHNDIVGVTDAAIKESTVPKAEGSDGLVIDRLRARAILDNGYSGSLTMDGAIKDFNTYISSDSDEEIVFETKFQQLPTIRTSSFNPNPYGYMLPAIFFKINSAENELYCAGGTRKSKFVVRAIIMSDSEFLLAGAVSLFKDLDRKCFPVLTAADTPLDEYGGLKDSGWQYTTFLASYDTKGFIERVLYTPVQPTEFTRNNPKVYTGICDFFVNTKR